MKQKVVKRVVSVLLCMGVLFSLVGCSSGKSARAKQLVSITTESYDGDELVSKVVRKFKYKGDKVSISMEADGETSQSDWMEMKDGVLQILENDEVVGQYQFSDLGCVTGNTVFHENGEIQSVSIYDDYGVPVEDSVYGDDKSLIFYTAYNELGLPVREIYWNASDLAMIYTTVEQDNDGRPTKVRMMKTDGSMGLLTITYSEDGLTRTMKGETITITAKFDEDGRLLYWENSTYDYDRDRQLIIYEYK